MDEYVLLVDEHDNEIGTMEKMQAHRKALLHRAISVFVFNDRNELLLQRRAEGKYHSPLLWTNTCCSHPRPGEQTDAAAQRRLIEEMGMSCDLKYQFSFTYKAELEDGLTEHEFDHVYFGFTNQAPTPNSEEVEDWKYMTLAAIETEIETTPELYTSWFKLMLDNIKNAWNGHTN